MPVFLNAIHQQALNNLNVAENISSLYDGMKERLHDTLPSKWNLRALDFIFTNPIFRNSRFTNQADILPPVP